MTGVHFLAGTENFSYFTTSRLSLRTTLLCPVVNKGFLLWVK
jgi:hypothetical protein